MIVPTIKLIAVLASVHLWYDKECCADVDCHPVPPGTVKELRDGVAVTGYGILDYSDPRLRWSKDGGEHVCIAPSGLMCVYRPPKGM